MCCKFCKIEIYLIILQINDEGMYLWNWIMYNIYSEEFKWIIIDIINVHSGIEN